MLLLAVAGGSWWYTRHRQESDTDRLLMYGNIDCREACLAFNDSEHIDEILVILRGVFLEGDSYDLLFDQYWPMVIIATLAMAVWLFRHRIN